MLTPPGSGLDAPVYTSRRCAELGGRARAVVRRRLGVRVALRRRLVLVGVELGAAGVLVGRVGLGLVGLVLVGGLVLVLLRLVRVPELVAAAARVLAEEGRRDERLLGQRERAAVL